MIVNCAVITLYVFVYYEIYMRMPLYKLSFESFQLFNSKCYTSKIVIFNNCISK